MDVRQTVLRMAHDLLSGCHGCFHVQLGQPGKYEILGFCGVSTTVWAGHRVSSRSPRRGIVIPAGGTVLLNYAYSTIKVRTRSGGAA